MLLKNILILKQHCGYYQLVIRLTINKINNNNKKQKNEKRSSKILQRSKRFRVY
jgi:hypothetical protein